MRRHGGEASLLPLGRLTGLTDMERSMNATQHDVLGATLLVYMVNGPRYGMQYTLPRITGLGDNRTGTHLHDEIMDAHISSDPPNSTTH